MLLRLVNNSPVREVFEKETHCPVTVCIIRSLGQLGKEEEEGQKAEMKGYFSELRVLNILTACMERAPARNGQNAN